MLRISIYKYCKDCKDYTKFTYIGSDNGVDLGVCGKCCRTSKW
jgi:hypothetical protein